MKYELYPKDISRDSDLPSYYIEFLDLENDSPLRWKLYRRYFLYSVDEWKEIMGGEFTLASREGHPYVLLEGELHGTNCIPNKKWIMYMVDALNEKDSKI